MLRRTSSVVHGTIACRTVKQRPVKLTDCPDNMEISEINPKFQELSVGGILVGKSVLTSCWCNTWKVVSWIICHMHSAYCILLNWWTMLHFNNPLTDTCKISQQPAYSTNLRVSTILILGCWVLPNIHQQWVVLGTG